MEKNTMTKDELVTRVEKFIDEITPTIKAINEEGKNDEGTIGLGMVFALAIPNSKGHHRFVGSIMGRKDGLFEALHGLENTDSLLSDYQDYKTAKHVHTMVSALEDFRDFLKAKIEAEEQKQGYTDNE